MSESMTDEQLAEIRAREAAATPGPWTWSAGMIEAPKGEWSSEIVMWAGNISSNLADEDDPALQLGACGIDAEKNAAANLAFLAAARQDVPALLAEVERLRDVQATLVDGGTYTASQLNRIARIVQRADLLHGHVVEPAPGEGLPTLDSVIQAITQILVEDEPVKNAWTLVWRELIGGMTLRSEQQLREMAERDRDEACAELERVGGMPAAELLAWRAER